MNEENPVSSVYLVFTKYRISTQLCFDLMFNVLSKSKPGHALIGRAEMDRTFKSSLLIRRWISVCFALGGDGVIV